MSFLIALVLLFISAKILGELAERLGMPNFIGEITAGILLGPAIFKIIEPTGIFYALAEIGIILELFLIGFEHTEGGGVLKYKKQSITVSALSSTMPIIIVITYALSQGFNKITAIFLAIALGATSIGISIKSLISVNRLESKAGRTILGSLVINDVIGLILLSGATAYAESVLGGTGSITQNLLKTLGGVALFFTLFFISNKYVAKLVKYTITMRVEEAQFSFVIITVLLSAWIAYYFGLSTIIGAFLAGIMLSRSALLETREFMSKLSSISYGFFVPIFYAVTGAMFSFANLGASVKLTLTLFAIITTTQVLCAFISTKLYGYLTGDALITGLAMLPYGEVTIVVMTALVALADKYPSISGTNISTAFSAAMMLILLSIIMTPILMRTATKMFPKTAAAK